MSRRITMLLAAGAIAIASTTSAFAQAAVTTPGGAKAKGDPTANSMAAQESPALRRTGKTPMKMMKKHRRGHMKKKIR